MKLLSVRIRRLGSIHSACSPRAASAAATIRLLRISPSAATASSERGATSRSTASERTTAHEPLELLVDLFAELHGPVGVGDVPRHRQVPRPERGHELQRRPGLPRLRAVGDAEQTVGRARKRRDDDGEPRAAAVLSCRAIRGSLASHDCREPLDRVRVGDRRPAELQDAHQRSMGTASTPSATSSSAFSTAAPAAPRTVLWPSAMNL